MTMISRTQLILNLAKKQLQYSDNFELAVDAVSDKGCSAIRNNVEVKNKTSLAEFEVRISEYSKIYN